MTHAQKIVFSNQKHALGISISRRAEISPATEALQLPAPRPVIVWIGGAGSMEPRFAEPVSKVARTAVQIAREKYAMIVDGATDGGVMAVLGQVYSQYDCSFPLVGVVAEQLVAWSNVPGRQEFSLTRKIQLVVTSLLVGSAGIPWHLEPNHTHFCFVPGNRWGAESAWISNIATQLAGNYSSVTILSNGRPGGICVQDVEHSLDANRPVIVMAGTGGWADELASQPPKSDLWKIVSVDDQQGLREIVLEHLAG